MPLAIAGGALRHEHFLCCHWLFSGEAGSGTQIELQKGPKLQHTLPGTYFLATV